MGTRTPLNLSGTERAELERVARRPSTPQALARRCRVILLDDREDMTYAEIGEELSMREQMVLKWRSRFLIHRMAGLRDAPRPGVKKKITPEMVAEVVRKTLEEKPPDATHHQLVATELIPNSVPTQGECLRFCACPRPSTNRRVNVLASTGRERPARWSELPGGQVAQGAVGPGVVVWQGPLRRVLRDAVKLHAVMARIATSRS